MPRGRSASAEAIDTLVALEEYIDTLSGWRGVAMVRIIERWTHHDAHAPFWSALAEFASLHSADSRSGHGFDDGLSQPTAPVATEQRAKTAGHT